MDYISDLLTPVAEIPGVGMNYRSQAKPEVEISTTKTMRLLDWRPSATELFLLLHRERGTDLKLLRSTESLRRQLKK